MLQRYKRPQLRLAGDGRSNQGRISTLPPTPYGPSITKLDDGVFESPNRGKDIGRVNVPDTPITRVVQSPFFLTLVPQIILNANPFRTGCQMQNNDTTNNVLYCWGLQVSAQNAFVIPAGGSVLYDFMTPTDILWAMQDAGVTQVRFVIAEMSKLPASISQPSRGPSQRSSDVMPGDMYTNISGGGQGGGGYAGETQQGTQMVWNSLTGRYESR